MLLERLSKGMDWHSSMFSFLFFCFETKLSWQDHDLRASWPLSDQCAVQERCSVVMRIAPTFLRFGSFEIFRKRDPQTGVGANRCQVGPRSCVQGCCLCCLPAGACRSVDGVQED